MEDYFLPKDKATVASSLASFLRDKEGAIVKLKEVSWDVAGKGIVKLDYALWLPDDPSLRPAACELPDDEDGAYWFCTDMLRLVGERKEYHVRWGQ